MSQAEVVAELQHPIHTVSLFNHVHILLQSQCDGQRDHLGPQFTSLTPPFNMFLPLRWRWSIIFQLTEEAPLDTQTLFECSLYLTEWSPLPTANHYSCLFSSYTWDSRVLWQDSVFVWEKRHSRQAVWEMMDTVPQKTQPPSTHDILYLWSSLTVGLTDRWIWHSPDIKTCSSGSDAAALILIYHHPSYPQH